MSAELIGVLVAVLAVGATLGGLILTGNRGLRQDMLTDGETIHNAFFDRKISKGPKPTASMSNLRPDRAR